MITVAVDFNIPFIVRLQDQSFAEGLERQLVKCALNPRVPEKIFVDPKRIQELAGLGQSIFAKSYKTQNPFSGIVASGMAGYGQLRKLHALRENFIKTVSGMRSAMNNHPTGSPARSALQSAIDEASGAFKSKKRRSLAELGATAEPRLKFFRTTVPAAAGLGAGAAGGYAAGNIVGNANEQNNVAGAPVSSRLSYLMNPSNLPSTPPPLTQPAPMDGSIQDPNQ